MAYERIIELYEPDAETLISTISRESDSLSKVTSAEFELLRLGGCGSGSMTINDQLISRTIDVGQYVKFKYDASTTWYFGRVEEVEYSSASGCSVRLYGLFSHLNEILIGGLYFGGRDRKPHRYSRSDIFIDDPDYSVQSWDTCSRYDQMLQLMYDQYIAPNSPIGMGTIAEPTSYLSQHDGFQSATFRSQESVALVVRSAAAAMDNCSFGVDELGDFFVKPKIETVLQTFKENVDLTQLRYRRDKSLLYTRIYLTGDYIYGVETAAGFSRYQAVIKDVPGSEAYGDKQIQIYVPYIRTDEDAFDFARGFFQQYAQPTVRIDCTTLPQATLLKPWNGRLTVRDRNNDVLLTDYFSRVRCVFNARPFFELSLGSEEMQYQSPPEPQRWELDQQSPQDEGPSDSIDVTATAEVTYTDSSSGDTGETSSGYGGSSSDGGEVGSSSSDVFIPESDCNCDDYPEEGTIDFTFSHLGDTRAGTATFYPANTFVIFEDGMGFIDTYPEDAWIYRDPSYLLGNYVAIQCGSSPIKYMIFNYPGPYPTANFTFIGVSQCRPGAITHNTGHSGSIS